jgi:hypothetical protein
MSSQQYREPEGVFNWADHEPQPAPVRAELVRLQVVHLPQVTPGAQLPEVRIGTDGMPFYAYRPMTEQPYDPLPARLHATAVVMASGAVLAVGIGAGCWLMFAGLSLVAVGSVVGVGLIAAAVVCVKLQSGVRISQGDGSNLQIGGRR